MDNLARKGRQVWVVKYYLCAVGVCYEVVVSNGAALSLHTHKLGFVARV